MDDDWWPSPNYGKPTHDFWRHQGFSALWWAGLCGAFVLCQRLLWKNVWRCDNKIYLVSITVDDGGYIGRDISLSLFSSHRMFGNAKKSPCWTRCQNFGMLGGGPKKEKSDRPPHWWFKPLCFLLMTHLLYLLFHLFHLFGDLIWLVYLVMWFSCTFLDLPRIRHRVRRATDRSSRRRRCHPKSGRRGCHWLRKNAGKPWIYQPNNAK